MFEVCLKTTNNAKRGAAMPNSENPIPSRILFGGTELPEEASQRSW
jgi:hypothetical protein